MSQTMSGQWGAYPLEETNGNARRPPKRNDPYGSLERGQSAQRETKAMRPSDPWNVMSDSEEVKQRRVSLKANNSTASKKRSRNTLRTGPQGLPADLVDDSAWIHRDKLAEIEIQELEEAGIYVRPSRRSMSAGPGASRRSSRSASRSRMPINDDEPIEPVPDRPYNPSYDSYRDKPLPSPPTAHEEDRGFDPELDSDFRTPEEIAAEQGHMRSQLVRPSTSRIPISKMSPVPVPSNVIERDSPLPRSRHGSGGGSGNWDDMQYARRARSSSIASQVMLDEDSQRRTPPEFSKQSSTDNSPPKARMPTKATPKSGARKGSTPSSTERPGSSYGKDRNVSTTSQRPGSRAGSGANTARPSTSHRHAPEGDPPWIDSMYKPDPRLPPDQQMLPTHAKRMMQEQWEKEGRASNAYDRDLNPMSDRELPSPKPKPKPLNLSPTGGDSQSTRSNSPSKLSHSQSWQQHQAAELPAATTPNSTNGMRWPLTPKGSEHDGPPPTPSRPGTSGGLKLTPRVPTPPPIVKSSPASPERATMQGQAGVLRVPEMDEKQEAKPKKGCCCVVM